MSGLFENTETSPHEGSRSENGHRNSGYRLSLFEFYNWGCFDRTIFRIQPDGKTSLLTGANGSGKTTVVDALVTLLVPPVKRHYNQSSGSDRKRERTEESYIRGAYGSIRGEESISTKTQFLRKGDVHSCLVGVFCNAGYDRSVTLGQFRHFIQGRLKRIYFIAYSPLSVKEDILPAIEKGELKKGLKNGQKIHFYESFQQYAQHFSAIFGLRSEKALSLFSHIVGVKVLGNLNEFIRINMLEAPDMEKEFEKLHSNYRKLLNAHQKIELAEKQLELLEPVMKSVASYEKYVADEKKKNALRGLLPGYFAAFITRRLLSDIADSEEELRLLKEKEKSLQSDKESLERERRSIEAAIDRNDTAMRIKAIEHESELAIQKRGQKKERCVRYMELVDNLDLAKVEREDDFIRNKAEALEKQKQVNESLEKLDDGLFVILNRIKDTSEELEKIRAEIESLKKRTGNIPHKNIEVRERIASMLDIEAGQLPFAGELIRVKEDQLEWELAAERLLHNFALCLLIRDEYYAKVNRYVNTHDLKNRLIYYRIDAAFSWDRTGFPDESSLIYKLQVKPDAWSREWLEDYINIHFDYICLENTDQFSHYAKAVTKSGLVKNDTRHEKDDRPERKERESFILGWDNRSKIAFLSSQALKLQKELSESEKNLAKQKSCRAELESRKTDLTRFAEFRQYGEINFGECDRRLRELEEEEERLLESADELKDLSQKLKTTRERLSETDREQGKVNQFIGSLNTEIANTKNTLHQYETALHQYDHINFDDHAAELSPYLPRDMAALDFDRLKNEQETSMANIVKQIAALHESVIQEEKKLVRAMNRFANPGPEILKAYTSWTDITLDLRPEIEFIPDFLKVYEVIKKDDLPRYKKEFKEFLNEKMLEDMVNFNESLSRGEKDIIESISELNNALKSIEYNKTPLTFIVLHTEESRDGSIRDFRSTLKNILGDAFKHAARDEKELEHTFKKMQVLILDLNDDPNKRKKVLDVRNWLKFSAVEYYREDGTQKQFYEDSQSLSGGEKAKLAYTILASAIAYQFGIQGSDNPDKSFRFAVVDEAFSKVDPENSVYAMELFRKMQLQLMVVTPLDKINLTEDYINSVHFVENSGKSASHLYNLTLEEYREKKEAFLKSRAEKPEVKAETE